LKPWDPLSKVFTCGPEVGHLQIVVKRPAGACNCLSTTLRCWFIRLTIFCHPRQNSCSFSVQNFPNTAPSSQGVPPEFAELQRDERHTIRWNRPPSAASSIPSTLLHPIFGKFIDDCENCESTAADNKLVWTLSAAMSGFFKDESARASTFWEILHDSHFEAFETKVEGTKFKTDGNIHCDRPRAA